MLFRSIIMAAGLYICFFISHKKIWINIADDKKSVRIVVGGSTSRNRLNLENEIEKIVSHAAQAIEGRSGK